MADDGVNREGLDYRAGWLEGLHAFVTRMDLEGIRAKRNEQPGLNLAENIAKKMYDAMVEKMTGTESDSQNSKMPDR